MYVSTATINVVTSNTIYANVGEINFVRGDLEGSVFADDSSVFFDAIDNSMYVGSASVAGNIIANVVNANTISATGNLISNGNVAVVSSINRNIYVSSLAPTSGDGNDGDIWFQIP